MGKKKKEVGFETSCIHNPTNEKNPDNSLEFPVFLTSTYALKDADVAEKAFAGNQKGVFSYSRFGNPTVAYVEEKMARLEQGEGALGFASGLAAITSTVLSYIKTGDHIITDYVLYGPVHHFFESIRDQFKVEIDFIDMSDVANVKKAIKPNTKIVYIETPANPTLKILDIEAICSVVRKENKDIKLLCDNTFSSPYLQNPIPMGVDVVLHSATKYINGHGDVIAGFAVASADEIKYIKAQSIKDLTGACLGPFQAFLINRGLKTLRLRMDKHCDNAQKIIEFLSTHSNVGKILYPGLKTHPLHEVAKKQMKNFGGIFSFEVKGGIDGAKSFLNKVKLATCAVSLGDTETLVLHPATTTHSSYSQKERLEAGITDGLVRVSVGIESIEDLIEDFKQALS